MYHTVSRNAMKNLVTARLHDGSINLTTACPWHVEYRRHYDNPEEVNNMVMRMNY